MFLPVNLNLSHQKVVLIGGGKVALQKLKTLIQFTEDLTVVAPSILPEIKAFDVVSCLEQNYQPEVLQGCFLVYACTDNRTLNRQVWNDAQANHQLVNVADDPSLCSFLSSAIHQEDGMSIAVNSTLAVRSQGKDVKRAVRLRNHIRELLRENPLDSPTH